MMVGWPTVLTMAQTHTVGHKAEDEACYLNAILFILPEPTGQYRMVSIQLLYFSFIHVYSCVYRPSRNQTHQPEIQPFRSMFQL